MDIDKYKYLNKINKNKQVNNNSKYFKNFFIRIILSVILFLTLAIMSKSSSVLKDGIYKNIYNSNLSFTKIKQIYDKYLGGVLPIKDFTTNIQPVFNEKLTYKDKSIYYDGVKLEVDPNYLVPVLQSGLVVYIGEKENYNNVVIIQGIDGIDIWYGNINTTSVNLYDYVEKATLLGEAADNSLYLVYSKDGKFLNYEEYLN